MVTLPGITAAATQAVDATPAGGAELAQVIGASAVGGLLTAVLLVLGLGHRSGRIAVLGRGAALAERQMGLPGWAALPVVVATASLVTAVIGMYWDISLHIDNGRDPGPLANPSHYAILFGLFGLFAAGFLALVLPRERPGGAAVRLTSTWWVPVGGIVLMACGAFALIGFPLDDVSHRLFGQDVTLWGPTHLMLIGGAGLSLVGILILLAEGRQARRAMAPADRPHEHLPPGLLGRLTALTVRFRVLMACGGLLTGLSVYQGEYDFGVPQFRLLFHPVLIALAAGAALTVGRVLVGRGGALGAAVFFLVLRGGLALLVGGALGESTPHFPLYLGSALAVEAVALWLGTARRMRFALAAGAAVGVVGTLSEFAWSQAWMPLPWPGHLLLPALALALPVAVAAAVLGVFCAGALQRREEVASSALSRRGALAALLVVGAVVAALVPTSDGGGLRAEVTLTPVAGSGSDEVVATVRPSDPAKVRDADFFETLAWQGREPLRGAPLREVAPGVFRSEPVPVGGTWKTMIRLHKGTTLASLPVSLPEDTAIPAAAVPAAPRFDRAFVADAEVLQRERATDAPTWLWAVAGFVVLGIAIALLALMGWALLRMARTGAETEEGAPPVAPPAPAPVGVAG